MRILVVGRGWTGQKVYQSLINRYVEASICSHDTVHEDLLTFNPTVVINCAGVTGSPNVDQCEEIRNETYQGNTVFPIRLYTACENLGIDFAHFSSGCIYEGIISSVNQDPNFFGSTYSISKGISDAYLKSRAWVFRIRMPFTDEDHPKSFITKIKKYDRLINSGLNSLSHHDEAIDLAIDTILQNLPKGPYNLVNQGALDLQEICSILGIEKDWMTQEEFVAITKCQRSNCVIPADTRMREIHEVLHSIRKLK